MGSKNRPGSFDCYANAEPDEPMFVLLGRDKHAPQLVEMWAGMRAMVGEDPAKVEEALKCAKAMRKWRHERKGVPTCEYCEASDEAETCSRMATKLITSGGFVWYYWCENEEACVYNEDIVSTFDGYFATDEVHNEYIDDESLRVFHATKGMRARDNEAVMGEPKRVGRREEETGVEGHGMRETGYACNGCGTFSANESDPCPNCDDAELPDYGGGISGG